MTALEFYFQGGHLYDKGENDELFHVVGYPQPIYRYILARKNKKVKNILEKFFSTKKGYVPRKKW